MKAKRCLDLCLYGVGGLLIILAISVGISWPFLYDKILESNLLLANNSKSYSMWVKTPLPMYLDIYLFNCTNAIEFKKNPGTVKPNFEEIGPFVYEEMHERVAVEWNNDGTVSYNQTRKWILDSELSVPLDSLITNLDIVSLTISYVIQNASRVLHPLADIMISQYSNLFITKPASEWIFDGMDVKILDEIKTIEKYFPSIVKFPLPFDKFGFFYRRNMSATYDGRFTALTGSRDLRELGMLVDWNDRNTTDFFPDTCGEVQGSSGEIFPPLDQDQRSFSLFISDVCSELAMKYAGENTVSGVTGKEFIGDASMFGNNESVPEQACYCRGRCHPPGVRDLTVCRQGAPVFASFPHFYLADSSYLENIEGLSPNQSLHEFRLTIDPVTGIPLTVRARMQVNALLKDYGNFSLYKNVPTVFIPMMWFSQRVDVTQTLASQARLLTTVHQVAVSVLFVIGAIGLLMIMSRLWLRHRTTSVRDDYEPIVPDGDDDASS